MEVVRKLVVEDRGEESIMAGLIDCSRMVAARRRLMNG